MVIKSLKAVIIILFLGACTNMHAQFNIKVGYTGGVAKLSSIDNIFQRFNDNQPDIEKGFDNFRYQHGLDLGLRYSVGSFAFDAGYSVISSNKDAIGVDGGNEDFDMKLSTSTIYAGIESRFGMFGVGGNIGYQKLKAKGRINTSERYTLYSQQEPSSKFYLIVEAGSDNIAFSIRPFINVNWKSYNVRGIENELSPELVNNSNDYNQDVTMYGISLFFYNGPQ